MIKLIYTDLGKKNTLHRSNHTTKNELCNSLPTLTVSDLAYYLEMRRLPKKNGTFIPPSTCRPVSRLPPPPKKNSLSTGISIYGEK